MIRPFRVARHLSPRRDALRLTELCKASVHPKEYYSVQLKIINPCSGVKTNTKTRLLLSALLPATPGRRQLFRPQDRRRARLLGLRLRHLVHLLQACPHGHSGAIRHYRPRLSRLLRTPRCSGGGVSHFAVRRRARQVCAAHPSQANAVLAAPTEPAHRVRRQPNAHLSYANPDARDRARSTSGRLPTLSRAGQ